MDRRLVGIHVGSLHMLESFENLESLSLEVSADSEQRSQVQFVSGDSKLDFQQLGAEVFLVSQSMADLPTTSLDT